MDWYDKLMLIVGMGMGLTVFPHILQMYSEKSASGQSIYSPIILSIFCALWLIYGLKKKDSPIILTNLIALVANIIYTSVIFYYQLGI